MTPTEHEGTVAMAAAERKYWELKLKELAGAGAPNALPEYDDLPPLKRQAVGSSLLPVVWAALEALPDRAAEALDEVERRLTALSSGREEDMRVGDCTNVVDQVRRELRRRV